MWKKNNISNVINYFISVFFQDRNDFFHLTDYFFMRHSLNFQDLLTRTFVSLVNLINETFLCPHKSRKRSFNCIWRRQRDKWAYVVVFIIECCIITSVRTKKNNYSNWFPQTFADVVSILLIEIHILKILKNSSNILFCLRI